MKEIVKWLNTLNPTDVSKSNTTSSVYYIVKGLQIRLADHLTYNTKTCDLQIILPINNTNIYLVGIKEGLQVLGFNTLEDLAAFINHYALIKQIQKTSEFLRETYDKEERDTIKNSIVNNKKRTRSVNWSKICEYLYKDCPKFKNISKKCKQVCKSLFESKLPYNECVDIISQGIACENLTADTLRSFFEPYLHTSVSD